MPETQSSPSSSSGSSATRIYFLRHTHALPNEDDAARPLSDMGKAQAAQVAKFCKSAGIVFDVACSSPLLRARETAEIVLAITNAKTAIKLQRSEALLNETSPSAFYQWLKDLPPARHILLVGHNPSLTDRLRHFLSCPRGDSFNLPKGGLACLKTEDRLHGTLKFLIHPKIL